MTVIGDWGAYEIGARAALVVGLCLGSLTGGPAMAQTRPQAFTPPPLTAAALAAERQRIGDIIKGVTEDTTPAGFEALTGRKLTFGEKNDGGTLGSVDNYAVSGTADTDGYWLTFHEGHPANGRWFEVVADFGLSHGDPFSDDTNCLSLGDIKAMAQAAGWAVDRPYMYPAVHGLTASKGQLILQAEAPGSAPEHASAAEVQTFIDEDGFKGCAENLRIQLTAAPAKS